MASHRLHRHFADAASAAVWASLGAALVVHGCASTPARVPAAARRPEPPPAVAQVPPPAPEVPPEPKPVFEERPAVPTAEPDVRIRVAALRGAAPTVRASNPSGRLQLQAPGVAPRAVRTPVDVRAIAGGWRITEGAGSRQPVVLEVRTAGPVEFHPPAGAHGIVNFDRTDWPGPLRVVAVDDAPGAVDVVIDVPLERYLPGVLAKELFRHWSPEAFRAQAIAARSFSVCEHAHWTALRHYDMVAGEASQAWVGTTADAKPRDAVAATRGMVLAFDGRVVPAYYSSTCGGTPANATDAITRNPNHGIAPLAAGGSAGGAHRDCCSAAPRFRWSQSFANDAVCAQLRRWAGDQLAVRKDREGARIARACSNPPSAATRATGAAAPSAPAPAAQAIPADAADSPSVPASPFTELADDAPLAELAGIREVRAVQVVAVNAAGRPARLRLVDQQGRALEMRAEDFRRAVNYAREGEAAPKERLNSSHLDAVAVRGGKLEFTGHGYGHGVGMCQWGAQSMAASGKDALTILRAYYPGSTVVRGY